ncbi:uroporphyrinogen-III C-methyltransferase [Peptostreptococcus sp. D1]|uniref:uroporphyrinogen-III C-methyltransferase n=1 Tax=Peptostreptococcus sp. D1 TaxID=72304 RepID=UPI0008EB5100|nr:uroporphyrinogen-III C-methyltransferase [Peptostreptococcus sp. D1]SFE24131.1 uroporphyrinogen III methyltransferase / synthase [Peptostreptococcus sp. D1]
MSNKVYIVGAGPGDYGLITLKAVECIKKADVLVYDRLVNPDFLNLKKDNCEVIYVGKESSNHIVPQDQINRILIDKFNDGKAVVRLKGGDPYVFGRGGEEAEALYDEGIEFEVVPGVTSAIGGLCYAGIPVTHRDYSSSFHIVTGHSKKDDQNEINWSSLSKEKGTLIFLMGIGNIGHIVKQLIENGKEPNTPVAFVSWATRHNQKTTLSTLKDARECVEREKIKAPTIFVVGAVVKLADKLNFFEKKPLFGKNIAITRSRAKNSELRKKLEEKGAKVIEIPTIDIKSIESSKVMIKEKIDGINDYDYLAFTSHNSVKYFFDILKFYSFDLRKLANVKLCSIGAATTSELEAKGVLPDITSERFDAVSLAVEISKHSVGKVLFPCSEIAGTALQEYLGNNGFAVDRIEVYSNRVNYSERERVVDILSNSSVDFITFTSSSTFENIVELMGAENISLLEKCKIISIGDITTKTIKSKINNNVFQSKEVSMESMVEKIIELL